MTNTETLQNPDPSQTFDESYSERFQTDYQEDMNRTYEDSLFPYSDDEFLVSRLTAPNRALRNFPELKETMSKALLQDDDESLMHAVDELAAARELAKPSAEKPVGTILSYVTMASTIMEQKDAVVGPYAPTDRSNAMAVMAGRKMCEDVPDDQVPAYLLSAEYLIGRVERLPEGMFGPDFHLPNVVSKLQQLSINLISRYNAIKYAEAYPSSDTREFSGDQIERDSQEVATYFASIRASQDTGIKLAYKPDDLGGSIVFAQPFAQEFHRNRGRRPNSHPVTHGFTAIAEVMQIGSRHPKRLKPTEQVEGAQSSGITYDGLEHHISMYVAEDGELYTDPYCKILLRDTFVQQGKYQAYREMHAGILSDYFDMTHNVETVFKVRREIDHDTEAMAASGMVNLDEADPMNVIRRMVVPRVSKSSEPATPEEQEPAEPDDQTIEEQDSGVSISQDGRKVRLHNVTWFRRPLPEGWKASPQAIELAAEAGITLKDGETSKPINVDPRLLVKSLAIS